MLYTCLNGHEYGLHHNCFSDLNDEKRCPVCAVTWAFVRVTAEEASEHALKEYPPTGVPIE